jgi:hypothetical protein
MSLKLIIKKIISDLYKGISKFKKGYQPRRNIIKDKNCNLLTSPQSAKHTWDS